ncbi:hypothetical protein BH24DEI1_BH24DEI1_01990 [soil metagenome]
MDDAEHIRRPFDAYGVREWERHEARPPDRVSGWLHKHYLARFVTPGRHVLEPGVLDGGTHIVAVLRRL